MESILTLLVVALLAGLSNWLQRRAQSRHEAPPEPHELPPVPGRRPPARPPAPPSPTMESTLERELRRLLGEEPPPPPRQPPPAPAPPPIQVHTPPPIIPPAPPVRTSPTLVSRQDTAPSLRPARAATRVRDVIQNAEQLRRRYEASSAIARKTERSPASIVASLTRNPAAARQAFVASVVFNPPKALEE